MQGARTVKGRKPTPTALKLVRGNPGRRPLRLESEARTKPAGVKPDWLTGDAADQWDKVSAQLSDAGILTNVDEAALALYCETFVRWRHAIDQVTKYGPVVKAPSGFPVQSPYLAIANRCHDQMLKLLVEFGMTPSSRSRVHAEPPTENAEAPKSGLESFRQ